MTLADLLFWVLALTTCGTAIAVVLSENVVRMAVWLILSLGSVACLFFLLAADFAGAAQLLIYVGGTVVLLVFGVMLTATGPLLKIKSSPGELFVGAGVGLTLLFVLASTIAAVDWTGVHARQLGTDSPLLANVQSGQVAGTTRPLGMMFLGLRPDKAVSPDAPPQGYFLPFEIVSVHLLVVLVGASYLARAKRRRSAAPVES